MGNRNLAGLTLLLIAIFPIGVWFIYLAVGNPSNITWQDNLNHLMSGKNELLPWFYASIVSCLISTMCAITYFSKISNSKIILLLLLVACSIQSIVAIYSLQWSLKIIYFLPALLAYLAYKNPNQRFQVDGSPSVRRA